MARSRLLDLMQTYPFWVFDASGITGNPLFSILTPELGFSVVQVPEVATELREIQPGNWQFSRKVVKKASVGTVMLQRGARFYDSDFYIWMTNAIKGVQPLRRNLVIVQYLGYRMIRPVFGRADTSAVGAEVLLNSLGSSVGLDRIPGRAWFCGGCVPTRYRPGDLDAKSSDVTIMELECQPEYVHELTIGTLSPLATRAISLGLAIAEAAGAPGV